MYEFRISVKLLKVSVFEQCNLAELFVTFPFKSDDFVTMEQKPGECDVTDNDSDPSVLPTKCRVERVWKTGDTNLWPVLNLVEPELRRKIKLVHVFSQVAAEVIFVTTDDKVGVRVVVL